MKYVVNYNSCTIINLRNSKKSATKIAQLEEDVKEAESRLTQMKREREEIEEDAKKLLKCVEEIEESLTEGDEAFTSKNFNCCQ